MFKTVHTNFKTELAIERALEAWTNFCIHAPTEAKHALSLSGDRRNDDGYNYRDGLETNGDRKEFCHIADPILPELMARTTSPAARDFLSSAQRLLPHVEALTRAHVHDLKYSLGIDGLHDEIFSKPLLPGRHRINLRFLHYLPQEETQTVSTRRTLAHPHIDYGGITFHLAESYIHKTFGGVEYLDPATLKWRNLQLENGFATCFPGLALQAWSRGKFVAPCHRVRVTQSFACRARFAIVAFVNLLGTEYVGPRLAEFKPGFNYTLTPEELQSYFASTERTADL